MIHLLFLAEIEIVCEEVGGGGGVPVEDSQKIKYFWWKWQKKEMYIK